MFWFFKGNLKCYLRLTMATRPATPVLGIKKAVLEKAGLPDFSRVLREAGHQAMDSKNTRWIRLGNSDSFPKHVKIIFKRVAESETKILP